jgi:hypothetical protein
MNSLQRSLVSREGAPFAKRRFDRVLVLGTFVVIAGAALPIGCGGKSEERASDGARAGSSGQAGRPVAIDGGPSSGGSAGHGGHPLVDGAPSHGGTGSGGILQGDNSTVRDGFPVDAAPPRGGTGGVTQGDGTIVRDGFPGDGTLGRDGFQVGDGAPLTGDGGPGDGSNYSDGSGFQGDGGPTGDGSDGAANDKGTGGTAAARIFEPARDEGFGDDG